jgi:hypothetical protein
MAQTKAEFERRLIDALEQISGSGLAYDATYLFQAQDYGAGDIAEVIRGPVGRRGTVISAVVFNVTEVFNSVTTAARLDVGDGSDQDGYALSSDYADVAVAGSGAVLFSAGALGNDLPGDTEITLTMVAPTGGTPTGIADTAVVISWHL